MFRPLARVPESELRSPALIRLPGVVNDFISRLGAYERYDGCAGFYVSGTQRRSCAVEGRSGMMGDTLANRDRADRSVTPEQRLRASASRRKRTTWSVSTVPKR